ncbi:hypothetical protein M5689_025181 [Euphorbia peplus]|nr:hypothetical protein M5689_025181 [Euphorbia peplus]
MSTICDVHYHYGGKWVLVPKIEYVGGEVSIQVKLDVDHLSYKDLKDEYLSKFGYEEVQQLFYVEPGKEFDIGLKLIEGDEEIRVIIWKLEEVKGGAVHIYAIDGLDMPISSHQPCNGQIETQNSEVGVHKGKVLAFDTDSDDYPYEPSQNEDCSSEETDLEFESDVNEEGESGSNDDVGDEEYDSEEIDRLKANQERFRRDISNRIAGNVQLEVGQSFANAEEFRLAISAYAVREGVPLKPIKSCNYRVRYKCVDGCPFKVLASSKGQSAGLVIKTLTPEHECSREYFNPRATAKFLCCYFKDMIRGNPEYSVGDMVEHCREFLKLQVSDVICKNAKRKIIREVDGGYKDEYSTLEAYANELQISNPGSRIDLQLNKEELRKGKRVFQRIFISFDACKRGWIEGCRPIIGLDGCFLKDICKGQLLVAVGHDAMDHFFPIVWAVIEKENTYNWEWFVQNLKEHLQLCDGSETTIISDMQKGLQVAIKQELPRAEHRYCARHVLANRGLKYRGSELQKQFWVLAWSTYEEEFKDNLKKLGSIDKKAVEYLMRYPPQSWSMAFFTTRSKDPMCDNNIAESYNSWILKPRGKPILRMLEDIRIMTMKRLRTYGKMHETWKHDYSPESLEVLQDSKERATHCRIEFNGDNGYEVTEGGDRHCVVLEEQKCKCRAWQLSGIPCAHAVCALYHDRTDPINHIHHYYHKSSYISTYKYKLQPVRGKKFWRITDYEPIEPPKVTNMPGRPRKKRIRGANEVVAGQSNGLRLSRKGQIQKCTKCGQAGHKSTNCKGTPQIIDKSQTSESSQADKGKSVQGASISRPVWINPRRRLNEIVGFGYLYDESTSSVIYNPGTQTETVLDSGDGGVSETGPTHVEDPVVRFPIPSLSEHKRRSKRPVKPPTGERQIIFPSQESEILVPTNLPFQPPKLQWKGKKAITTCQLEAERESRIDKKKRIS